MLGYYKARAHARPSPRTAGGRQGGTRSEANLRITGRVKDLFKTSKGKYVAPAPIEDRLVMHTELEACVVTGANLGQQRGSCCSVWKRRCARAAMPTAAGSRPQLDGHLKRINATP